MVFRSATAVMSGAMLVIGLALIVRTIAAGGTVLSMGILLGVLFVLAGAMRLYGQIRS
jgi:hypothetical protein